MLPITAHDADPYTSDTLAVAPSSSSPRELTEAASSPKTPSFLTRAICLLVGAAVALLLLTHVSPLHGSFINNFVPSSSHGGRSSLHAAVALHRDTLAPAALSSVSSASRALLSTPDSDSAATKLKLRRRKQRAAPTAAAGSPLPTAAELLEEDVIAAGGRTIGTDTMPCAFSFHPSDSDAARTSISVTSETTYDIPPTSAMQNVLEWLHGVSVSYALGVQYAFSPVWSLEKPLLSIWTRFLGLEAGELTIDDLNQRLTEGMVNIVQIDNLATDKEAIDAVNQQIQGFGGGLTKHTAPPTLYRLRKMRDINSDVICQPQLRRVLRQKYCAARALRPVPFSLYASTTKPAVVPRAHPIHIGVQLSSVLAAGSGADDATTILAHLPATLAEHVDATGLVVAQLLETLRRHTRGALIVHLFAEPPLPTGAEGEKHELARILEHARLRAVISGDAGDTDGMELRAHLSMSEQHAFHHLATADILVAGWGPQALMAQAISEGVVLVPSMPLQASVTRPVTPFVNLPVCSPRQTLTYHARTQDAQGKPTDANTGAQATRIRAFFADEEAVNATAADSTAASAEKKDQLVSPSADLVPSRFELPLRRTVRRRHAEAHFLTRAFTTDVNTPAYHSPDATMMRHCQAIPEAESQE